MTGSLSLAYATPSEPAPLEGTPTREALHPAPHLVPAASFSFEQQLLSCQPGLRLFARRLCRNADQADDLVQGALMQAWAARERFHAGSSMKAWTFTILRNIYLSWCRKHARVQPWDQELADILLTTPPRQEASLVLAETAAMIDQMPSNQRDALLMVGACGLSYSEAAQLANCPVGTIKSRVARARASLRDDIASEPRPDHELQRQRWKSNSAHDRHGLAAVALMVAAMTTAQGQASHGAQVH